VYHLLHRSDQQFVINAAAANNISDVRPIFDSLDWTEESYRMLERIGQTGKQWQICSAPETDVCTILGYVYMHIRMYNIFFACTFVPVRNYMYVCMAFNTACVYCP